QRQMALDRGELVRAVEPGAVSVDGGAGRLDVSNESMGAEAVCRNWSAGWNVVAIGDVLGPRMRIVVVRVLSDRGGKEIAAGIPVRGAHAFYGEGGVPGDVVGQTVRVE